MGGSSEVGDPAAARTLHCEVQLTAVFRLLGKRWNGIILGVLLQRPARFGEIVRAVPGLTDRMLAERLQELADAGLVDRIVLEGPPVGVRYQLTERGQDLRGVFTELQAWADRHLLDGEGAADRAAAV
jgi:DNA-binding HxlR family transcriptional regulator